eukprot:TRINITY_DN5168_c0_g1_i2.p1 TRINITY_DN5168_c0_g1~~TRINITY_DN5168_c0_g1_i2.p1  ORF type:complete len:837 (+),score=225.62 TRINITY_DN5168_c0_g1_i2:96-2606(+)
MALKRLQGLLLPLRAVRSSFCKSSKQTPKRWSSTEAESNKSLEQEPTIKNGEIPEPPPPAKAEKPAEMEAEVVESLHTGVLWLSNLHPVKVGRFDIRHKLYDMAYMDPNLKRMIEKMDTKHAINITDIVHRSKEGGVFIHFQSRMYEAKDVAKLIREHLMTKRPSSFLMKQPIRSHLVRGRPFLHDMVAYPNKTVRVDFRGEPLEMETLYHELRRYGQMASLEFNSAKETPRYATAVYRRIHGAIGARNCLHGTVIHGTKLSINYSSFIRSSALKDFWNNYSRILLPTLLSASIALLYNMFDPIRVFNITNKITGRLNISNSLVWLIPTSSADQKEGQGQTAKLYNTLVDQAQSLLKRIHSIIGGTTSQQPPVWSESAYHELKTQLDHLAAGGQHQLLLLAGPTGCGKTTVVRALIEGQAQQQLLHLDFRRSDNYVTDDQLVRKLKKAVGYAPSMTSLYSLQRIIEELLAVSSRGVVAPTSTTETHVRHVLDCVTKALRNMRPEDEEEHHGQPPLIVLNGVDSVFKNDHATFATQILDWACSITHMGLATVVILCDENVAEDLQDEAQIPSYCVTLEDASKHQTLSFLRDYLSEGIANQEQVERAAEILGGRLSDINELVRRCTSQSQPLGDAINDLLQNATVYVHLHALGLGYNNSSPWSLDQAWFVLTTLAEQPEASFEKMLFSSAFNGDDEPLHAMQRAGIIRIHRKNVADPSNSDPLPVVRQKMFVQPARPLFTEAFRRIANDPTLSSGIKLQIIQQQQAKLNAKVKTAEEELDALLRMAHAARESRANNVTTQLMGRIEQLATLIQSTNETLQSMTNERKELNTQLSLTSG